jgi:hypothetical protein
LKAVKRILNVTENLGLFYNPRQRASLPQSLKPFAAEFPCCIRSAAREYVARPTYLSVQVADDRHIHLAPEFLQYINHSCEPNTFFDTKNGKVVALRDITPNEEITFFYPFDGMVNDAAVRLLLRRRQLSGPDSRGGSPAQADAGEVSLCRAYSPAIAARVWRLLKTTRELREMAQARRCVWLGCRLFSQASF